MMAATAFLMDARRAARSLRRAPGFVATIVVTLALGVGANTAIFSLVRALLLDPLPYRDADRLVFVWSDLTQAGYPRAPLAAPELRGRREGEPELPRRRAAAPASARAWSDGLVARHDPGLVAVGRGAGIR